MKIDLTWDEFQNLRPSMKASHLRSSTGEIQCLVYTQQIEKDLLLHLVEVAEYLRQNSANDDHMRYLRNVLASRSCVLYFPQCSTRTFTSFSLAVQGVGMFAEEIRDPELSSMYKGESELDTLLTLGTLSDLVVLRQMDSTLTDVFAYEIGARGMETRIINGGSGADAHPTQALLDVYTLLAHLDLNDLDKEYTVTMVGDLKRGRTARSLSYLLALFPNIKQRFAAPEELQMADDILEYLDERSIRHSKADSLDGTLDDSDAFYVMRIQDEYSTTSEELRKQYEAFHLTTDYLKRMKPSACILHPLPRRREIPIEIDRDERARYWEAVHRGKFMRMALVLHMFGHDDLAALKARSFE